MNVRILISAAKLLGGLSVVLLPFQNCALPSGFQASSSVAELSGTSFCQGNPADAACASTTTALTCRFNGSDLADGGTVTAYLNSTAAAGPCTAEVRTCRGGVLSGSYAFATCTPGAAAASCLFDGVTVPSGQNVRAFLTGVAGSSGCQSQVRTCTNGVLSGAYAFAACAERSANCLFDGQTVLHGRKVTAFAAAVSTTTCEPRVRTCLNGALSGSGDFASCTVTPAPKSCSFNGVSVASGQTVTAYASSTGAAASDCAPITRRCTDGSLSGTAAFASCQVQSPKSCLIQGTTVPSGGTITLYKTAVANASNVCETERRVCSNGVLSGSATFTGCTAAVDTCFKWGTTNAASLSLQDAVTANTCVEVQAGIFDVKTPVTLATGHVLRGLGADKTTLRAIAATWVFGAGDGVVSAPFGTDMHVSGMTLDGSGVATYAAAGQGLTIQNTVMTNTRCSGVGYGGPGMVVIDNVIKDAAWGVTVNGVRITCASAGGGVDEGAAIYGGGAGARWAPVISRNVISHIHGPALDVFETWGGTFSDNIVSGCDSWAAVSLFGASDWTISGNTISHPNDQPQQPYHEYCHGGPGGVGKSAGIFICQEPGSKDATRNVVKNNKSASYFGLLSIGLAYGNTFENNDVMGSLVGCGDGRAAGQATGTENTWRGNNCQGTPNTNPTFF